MRRSGRVVLVFTAVCLVPLAARGRAGELNDADRERARRELWAAIGSRGDTYIQFRDTLVGRGDAIRPFLVQAAKRGESWPERLMAAIALERLNQPKRLHAVVAWWSRAEVLGDLDADLQQLGRSLAMQCQDTPMVLIEKVWKGNELRNAKVAAAQDGAWAADALGWLGDERAVEPLILALERHCEQAPQLLHVITAAGALRRLAHPKAVPALCRASVLYGGDRAGRHALDALRACADVKTRHLIRGFAHRLEDGQAKADLLKVADAVRTKLPRRGAVRRRP
ncbi:MAG: hypothetical protein ISS72_04235 [Candidatus Brocadiae bacterium]|nr:hypothetical protein [Candidatus Brocadiia bacterium]